MTTIFTLNITSGRLYFIYCFQDFELLIKHSHTALTDDKRKEFIAELKEQFKDRDFDIALYDYYRNNGEWDGRACFQFDVQA